MSTDDYNRADDYASPVGKRRASNRSQVMSPKYV